MARQRYLLLFLLVELLLSFVIGHEKAGKSANIGSSLQGERDVAVSGGCADSVAHDASRGRPLQRWRNRGRAIKRKGQVEDAGPGGATPGAGAPSVTAAVAFLMAVCSRQRRISVAPEQ